MASNGGRVRQTLMSLNDIVSAPACADDSEAGGAGLVAEVEADAPFLPRAVRREHSLEPGRPDRLHDPSAAPPQAAYGNGSSKFKVQSSK
jgi:hypothetical protein